MKTEQEQIKAIKQIIDERVETTLGQVQGRHGNVIKTVDTIIIARDIVEAGYGDVSEYKAEIERLKEKCEEQEREIDKLEGAIKENDERCFDCPQVKQAQIDVLNKVKDIVFDYLGVKNIKEAEALSILDSTLTYDVVTCGIDELIEEVQNDIK